MVFGVLCFNENGTHMILPDMDVSARIHRVGRCVCPPIGWPLSDWHGWAGTGDSSQKNLILDMAR